MKLIRFRKPSAKSALGITKAKRRIKKATGITASQKPMRIADNAKRKVLRSSGYYSLPMMIFRAIERLFRK